MQLISESFPNNGKIPSRHTCDGDEVSTPLAWSKIPAGTQSLALIMDDPDIPQFAKEKYGIAEFDHWVVFNIPPAVSGVSEGGEPQGIPGKNSRGTTGYLGPCPPDREHRYVYYLYALDVELPLGEGSTKAEVMAAMQGHILEQTTLTGLYRRQ